MRKSEKSSNLPGNLYFLSLRLDDLLWTLRLSVCEGSAVIEGSAECCSCGLMKSLLWSGPGVTVRTLNYHAEDLGSNHTPDKLTNREFFLWEGTMYTVGPEMNQPRAKNLDNADKRKTFRGCHQESFFAILPKETPERFLEETTGRSLVK